MTNEEFLVVVILICEVFVVNYKKNTYRIEIMDYYLATHTYHSNEKKKEFLKRTKGRTNDMWVDRMNDPQNSFHERARVVQIFMGKADFFFCNWYAESEQTIIDKLDSLGAGEFVITMAVKIKHPIADTKEIQQMLTNLK